MKKKVKPVRIVDVCTSCGSRKLKVESPRRPFQVGDHVYEVPVRSARCLVCGEGFFHMHDLDRAHLRIATDLARRGPMSAGGFKLMRQALLLSATEVAGRLDVSNATISRWETGVSPVDRGAWLTVGSMVLDRCEGRQTTLDRIAKLEKRASAPRTIRLEP